MPDRDSNDGSEETECADRHLTYEIDPDERPSIAVVRAVGSFKNSDFLDLPPLYDFIDPEYLDGTAMRSRESGSSMETAFDYEGCRVIVAGDTVRVRALPLEAE